MMTPGEARASERTDYRSMGDGNGNTVIKGAFRTSFNVHIWHRQRTCASDFVLALRAARRFLWEAQKREQDAVGEGTLLFICRSPHTAC